ncbi:hypothetical protein BDV59DRAFT_183733 [Aspergillus ambiguus]|uniref:MIZ zinc finger domain protein n=1 Tax=Aspergillus ambiguus TaxID=176160 RepID=UPI003CCDF334
MMPSRRGRPRKYLTHEAELAARRERRREKRRRQRPTHEEQVTEDPPPPPPPPRLAGPDASDPSQSAHDPLPDSLVLPDCVHEPTNVPPSTAKRPRPLFTSSIPSPESDQEEQINEECLASMTPPPLQSPPSVSHPSDRLVRSSNSTANIFLGGVRRSWMLDAATSSTQPPLQLPSSAVSPASGSVPRSAQVPAARHHPSAPNPTPPQLPEQTPSSAGPNDGQITPTTVTSPSRQLLSSLNTDLATCLAGDPAVSAPSPLPPQQQQQSRETVHSVSTPPSTVAYPVSSESQSRSQDVVTTASHALPIGAVIRNGPNPSIAPVASPGTPIPTPRETRVRTGSPLPSTPQLPSQMANGSQHPPQASYPTPPAQIPSSTRQQAQEALPPQTVYTIDSAFFDRSLKRLEVLESRLDPEVELPRAKLLSRSCADRDCLFLAIHQIYCLATYDPAQLNLSPLHLRGLNAIQRLLVDNSRISPDFLRWCSAFPAPYSSLVHAPAYRHAAEYAFHCLGLLAQRWDAFLQGCLERGLPPSHEEIEIHLGIKSPCLVSTIFLSICRALPGFRNDQQISRIWHLDFQNYQRHLSIPEGPQRQAQRRQDTEQFIQLCRSLFAIPQAGQSPRTATATSIGSRANQTMQATIGSPSGLGLQNPGPQFTNHIVTQAGYRHSTGGGSPTRAANGPNNTMGHQSTPSPRSTVPMLNHPRPLPARTSSNSLPRRMPVAARVPSSGVPNHSSSVHAYQGNPPVTTTSPYSSPFSPMAFPSQIAQALTDSRTTSPMQFPVSATVQGQAAPHPRGPQPHVQVQSNGAAFAPQPGHPTFTIEGQVTQHPRVALLPPPGPIPYNNARPNPARTALHQAYDRDACNRLISSAGEEEVELFLYLSSFMVVPTSLGQMQCAYKWDFSLSTTAVHRFPVHDTPKVGHRSLRTFSDGCQVYRLRCIRIDPSTTEVTEERWSVTETNWPSVCYMFVNGVEVFVRRKVHYGRDLPLDITEHLREGENTISMHFIRAPAEFAAVTYALAVEVLDIADLARAKSLVQTLSASDSREQIRRRLAPNTCADDDLSVVSQDLTVELADPFTARIFDVPVRGRSCGHLECFDHDTWISTRASKSGKRPFKEDWKCPICGGDARPQSLVIDGFLVEVHAELARTNRLEGAKAILIKSDLSWELKADGDTQSSSGRMNGSGQESNPDKRKHPVDQMDFSHPPQRPKVERQPSSTARVAPVARQASEVIELD